MRALVYDGDDFHEILYGESTGDWIRSLSTATLGRLAGSTTRSVHVDPGTVQRLAQRELARRQPTQERALEAGAAAAARRRWTTVVPVFTNYSGG